MKTEPIEIFVASYKGSPEAGYGVYLQMGDNVAEYSGVLGDFTKNQADLISVTMALRSVWDVLWTAKVHARVVKAAQYNLILI